MAHTVDFYEKVIAHEATFLINKFNSILYYFLLFGIFSS